MKKTEASENKKIYTTLFLSTFKISSCTFGGGYVIVPLMKKRFVDELGWINETEMLDFISISQSAPGPIAVDVAIMVGYHVCGLKGAVIAGIGTILPPLIIISVISLFYKQFRDNRFVSFAMNGMLAGISAVICNVVIDMGKPFFKNRDIFSIIIIAAVSLIGGITLSNMNAENRTLIAQIDKSENDIPYKVNRNNTSENVEGDYE